VVDAPKWRDAQWVPVVEAPRDPSSTRALPAALHYRAHEGVLGNGPSFERPDRAVDVASPPCPSAAHAYRLAGRGLVDDPAQPVNLGLGCCRRTSPLPGPGVRSARRDVGGQPRTQGGPSSTDAAICFAQSFVPHRECPATIRSSRGLLCSSRRAGICLASALSSSVPSA